MSVPTVPPGLDLGLLILFLLKPRFLQLAVVSSEPLLETVVVSSFSSSASSLKQSLSIETHSLKETVAIRLGIETHHTHLRGGCNIIRQCYAFSTDLEVVSTCIVLVGEDGEIEEKALRNDQIDPGKVEGHAPNHVRHFERQREKEECQR